MILDARLQLDHGDSAVEGVTQILTEWVSVCASADPGIASVDWIVLQNQAVAIRALLLVGDHLRVGGASLTVYEYLDGLARDEVSSPLTGGADEQPPR